MTDERTLCAVLSQVLVAFTLELDGAFERAMLEAGVPGAGVSLAVWTSCMQYLQAGGSTAGDVAAAARSSVPALRAKLGCFERWHFVALGRSPAHRDWGSGRGVRAATPIEVTEKGALAITAWQELVPAIEARWRKRHGAAAIARVRAELAGVPLPFAVPDSIAAIDTTDELADFASVPGGTVGVAGADGADGVDGALPVLLSRALWTFALAFRRITPMPLALCATTLRALAGGPAPVRDLPRLTGLSPEMTAIGWRLAPYVRMLRCNIAALTPRGAKGNAVYAAAMPKIEARIARPALRPALDALFAKLGEALVPPAGTTRSGVLAPSLGRSDVASAAKRRARAMVAQTDAFRADPAGALPHFPRWDMNRGFGP